MTSHRIVPCIWLDDQAERAATFYARTFPGGRITATSRYPESAENPGGRPRGSVLTVEVELAGQPFTLLNGGPPGKFDVVVVTKIDRITRSIVHFYTLWEELKKHNFNFIALGDNFETTTAAGRAMLGITLIFAQLERERTSERTKEKIQSRRADGLWFGGTAPVGYKPHPTDKTKLVPESVAEAAEAAGVSPRTAYKWLYRFEEEGPGGLLDRTSRPKRSPTQVPCGWQQLMLELRRLRMTGAAIARRLGVPRSTVARILKRHGLERLKKLDPPVPVRRYEKTRPSEFIHLDIKKLGRIKGVGHRIHGDRTTRVRGIGWEFVHVCVDDYTRLAYVEVLEDEKGVTTAAFLKRAAAWLKTQGVTVERVMTDNGSGDVSKDFASAIAEIRVRHLRTRPYTPRTNGKAERFIQTMLREWACGRPFASSYRRRAALPAWLRRYNEKRPHAGIGGASPITRLRSAA